MSRAAEALVRVLCEALIYVLSRELSNGHFTEDNHKQLSGVGLAVPVYEAKMTRDTRLVVRIIIFIRALALQRLSVSHPLRSGLRVECMYCLSYIYTHVSWLRILPVRTSRLELYSVFFVYIFLISPIVIRIFGIYTHRQIDGRFWDAMSRYLNYQGSEYRRR